MWDDAFSPTKLEKEAIHCATIVFNCVWSTGSEEPAARGGCSAIGIILIAIIYDSNSRVNFRTLTIICWVSLK